MARIRSIKPEFFKHEELFDLEQKTGLSLRVAFAGLWCQSDREGRFRWRPRVLKLDVLPFDDCDFAEVLKVLEQHEFVTKYTVDGKEYGHIPTWTEHQSIPSKEPESKIPSPDEACKSTGPEQVEVMADPETLLVGKEGKGKEGEGKGERTSSAEQNSSSSVSNQIDEVLEHYKTYHPKAKPGRPERNKIRDRIKEGYTTEELKQAIDGNHRDPFCNGENEAGKQYHTLKLIFRDSDKVNQYIEEISKRKESRQKKPPDENDRRDRLVFQMTKASRDLKLNQDWIEEHINEPLSRGDSIDVVAGRVRQLLQEVKHESQGR